MPPFPSQRSLDSRLRGNDGFWESWLSRECHLPQSHAYRHSRPPVIPAYHHSRPSVIPAYPSSPPIRHSRLPPSPPTRHSRENGNPLRLHHSNSPTPTGDQEPKALRPMPAFLSQRSLDSRFRGNDGFWESWLSRECHLSGSHGIRGNATFRRATPSAIPAHPSFPPTGHPRLPPLPRILIPAPPPSPPTGHPRLPPFPPTCHSRLPTSPPTCHSRENGNPLRLHHSNSPTPTGDQESKAARPMPAFPSQRSLDSRFRGNDTFRRATASVISALPPSPPTAIPAHLSFPRKRESTAPTSFPRSSSPTPTGDQEPRAARPMPTLPVAKVSRFPLSRE